MLYTLLLCFVIYDLAQFVTQVSHELLIQQIWLKPSGLLPQVDSGTSTFY